MEYLSRAGVFRYMHTREPAIAMSDHAVDDQLRQVLPRLRRFAHWLTRGAGGADDLVQSTLERALSRWTSRRNDEALRAWLFSILYRLFLDKRRRSRRYMAALERLQSSDEPAQPSVEREVVAQAALEALQQLPPEQRSLLLWVSVEGLSYQEIADILEVPMGTVMSRLSRARAALRSLCEGKTAMPGIRLLK
jgi:RNA polymerase sigma-70 factor (ECF subfamily)